MDVREIETSPGLVFDTSVAGPEDGPLVLMLHGFGVSRHFWGDEMGMESADPGQDPRGAVDAMPLWKILDITPEGRGTDWYPKLEYGK